MDYSNLHLTTQQLMDISLVFRDEISKGIRTGLGQLKCLPAFVSSEPCPSGRSLVLDFGGTRLRAAVVDLNKGTPLILKGPKSATIPLERGVPMARDVFLDIQTRLIQELAPEPGLPFGYCFSYPIINKPDGDAYLLRWTKGVEVPGMVGEPVGRLLLEALTAKGVHCSSVVVINDTVASLLAGVVHQTADAHVGLIVGTGTNMATLIETDEIADVGQIPAGNTRLPVNLENGNLTPPYLTPWDDHVDMDSDNPGQQRFEKAVSGAYLPYLMKAILPNETIDMARGADQLSRWAWGSEPCSTKTKTVAGLILERSAKLVASSIAGLLGFLNDRQPIRSALVVAEGGLILNSKGYQQTVESELSILIKRLSLPTQKTEFVQIGHANLIGSALAALSHP